MRSPSFSTLPADRYSTGPASTGPASTGPASTGLRRSEGVVDAGSLLEGLTVSQLQAVTTDSAPLCIMAGAGAGKTRVLTGRIAWRCHSGLTAPAHTLALTFTRKAAGELQQRLARLGLRDAVAAGTFHAHAAAQLQRWWADRGSRPEVLLDRKAGLLGPLVAERGALDGVSLAEVAAQIEWAKARNISPEELEATVERTGRSLSRGVTAAALAAVYARYEHEKRRRGLVDFDDLLARCATAIESDPEFAGAQRWRWRHIYVDEFQDLNPLQHRLLLAWLGVNTDLCVVGDPNQAIYGWNGADPTLLTDMVDRWPGTEVVHLDSNHRCTEEIVRTAAAVLGPAGTRLRAAGRSGPVPVVTGFDSERAEAGGIAAGLRQAHEAGRPWSAMAVLTRTNSQLAVIETALTAAGIPYWSATSAALLDEPEVRQLVSELRQQPHSRLQMAAADLREVETGAAAGLAELADAFRVVRPDASVGEWLEWLPVTGRDRCAGSAGSDERFAHRVTLSSFHRAKGLEWEMVWVAGLEDGLVPFGSAPAGRPEEQEERRLLYVALTRAVTHLRLSWSATRTFGRGRPAPRRASRWLPLIEASVASAPAPDETSNRIGRDQFAEQRARLHRAAVAAEPPLGRRLPAEWPDTDRAVLSSLKAWRLEAARYSGIPPHMILHDITVEALASLRPASLEDLMAVPGLGPVKAQRYGPCLLDILSERADSA